MYKRLWTENVKTLLDQRGLTVAEAAEVLGTSRQYLSSILAEGEPQSAKEAIVENVNWLLHTDPAQLYALGHSGQSAVALQREPRDISLPDLSPVETAILAEQSFRGGHYRRAHRIAESLLELSMDKLVPAAVAQAELLSGKSACLSGDVSKAVPRLKSALGFYRKRLSVQPDRFFSLCIDSYRYLGLAFYLLGDYRLAIRQLVAACRLAEKYPHLAVEVVTRLEEVATNLLRAASRQGKRSTLTAVAAVVSSMTAKCGLKALTNYVTLELTLAQYPTQIVATGSWELDAIQRDKIIELFRLSCTGFESLQGYTFILGLYLADDAAGLCKVGHTVNSDVSWRHGGAAGLVAMFTALQGGEVPTPMSPASAVSEPSVFTALRKAGEATSLTGPETARLRHYLWQDALGALREEREFAMYILVLHWYLRATDPDELPQAAEIYRRLQKLTCDKWES